MYSTWLTCFMVLSDRLVKLFHLWFSPDLLGTKQPFFLVIIEWFSPLISINTKWCGRASKAIIHGNENDVEELEMLLEVGFFSFLPDRQWLISSHYVWLSTESYFNLQAYFMQIDGTLKKFTTVSQHCYFDLIKTHLRNLPLCDSAHWKQCSRLH
jgi:hypothetical protein